MKINLLLITLFLSIISYTQETNKVDSKGRKQGEWIKKDAKQQFVVYKGVFKDDYPVGKFIFYYPTGKVKAINNYVNKGQDSYASTYHENGKVMSYGKYVNQKRDSTWVYYDEFGNLSSTEEYANGEKNGKSIVYYPYNPEKDPKGPRILEIVLYKDGFKHGMWAKYFKNGAKLGEGEYLAGDYQGTQTFYHPNGNKMQEERYKNGQRHGYQIYYDGNGEETSRAFYYKGHLLEGEALERHLKRAKEIQMERHKKQNSIKN